MAIEQDTQTPAVHAPAHSPAGKKPMIARYKGSPRRTSAENARRSTQASVAHFAKEAFPNQAITSEAHQRAESDRLREAFMKISAAAGCAPTWPEPWDHFGKGVEHWRDHFVWGASQVNIDLATAGRLEFVGDLDLENDDRIDFLSSAMYWKLRQAFVEDAERGDEESFLRAVWRAYNAGRTSPQRLLSVPLSPQG